LFQILCRVNFTKISEDMAYKLINMEYLNSVSGGDKEIISELIDMFRDQSIEIYDEMKSLLLKEDYISLGMLAHKAKSSVAIMGMKELADLLKKFELHAKEGINPEEYSSFIERYRTDTNSALIELEDAIRK